VIYRVTDIADDKVVLDGNHPLAGMALVFTCTVTSIRPASEEEVEHGHVHHPMRMAKPATDTCGDSAKTCCGRFFTGSWQARVCLEAEQGRQVGIDHAQRPAHLRVTVGFDAGELKFVRPSLSRIGWSMRLIWVSPCTASTLPGI
jgi:hypothetical protein